MRVLSKRRRRRGSIVAAVVVLGVAGLGGPDAEAGPIPPIGLDFHAVVGWGYNENGELGDGTRDSRTKAVFSIRYEARSVAGGGGHSLAVLRDGSVWAWGRNSNGQLGDGTNTDSTVPVQVAVPGRVISVRAGFWHSLAMTEDGQVWAWGANNRGQLGDGTNIDRNKPVKVLLADPNRSLTIAARGEHSLLLKIDGRVFGWGANDRGQLGDNSLTDRWVPDRVLELSDVLDIAAGGRHSMAVTTRGEVYAWGANESGQLGTGLWVDRKLPTRVIKVPRITRIAAGSAHSLALDFEGHVWAWGLNNFGQLGWTGGKFSASPVPAIVPSLKEKADAIAAGDAYSAILSKGSAWNWGAVFGDDEALTITPNPWRVQGVHDATWLSGGHFHALAVIYVEPVFEG